MIDRGIKANTSGFMINKEIQFGISRVLEAMKEPEEKKKCGNTVEDKDGYLYCENYKCKIKSCEMYFDPIREVYDKWIGLHNETNMMENEDLVKIFAEKMFKAIEDYCKGGVNMKPAGVPR